MITRSRARNVSAEPPMSKADVIKAKEKKAGRKKTPVGDKKVKKDQASEGKKKNHREVSTSKNKDKKKQENPKEKQLQRQNSKKGKKNDNPIVQKNKAKAKQSNLRKSVSLPKKENSAKKSQKNDLPQEKRLKKETSKQEVKKAKEQKKKQEENIKKVIVKGSVPIDPHYNGPKNVHVLIQDTKVYSATLNQTNVTQNNNKFYILQILQSDNNPNLCYFFTRWGRVGVVGQMSQTNGINTGQAIRLYNDKYREKHHNGSYRQVDINFEEDQPDKKKDKIDSAIISSQASDYQTSKLSISVKNLIELIFDLNMMNKQMKEIGYDSKKMPLGKLSKNSIMKGYNILKQLSDEIQGLNRKQRVQQLCNDFYSYIPHDFGFQKMHNFVLNTSKKVKEKLQMLQALAQIKIATNLIGQGSLGNKIDANYAKLGRDIQSIDKDSPQFDTINRYLQTTHASTHRSYTLELVDLFYLTDERQDTRFTKDIHNKLLLWHGSRLTNFVGILSQGLRIAPPQAPVTGYMFGKGVYFADMSSKSANYCSTNRQNPTGILLLCEVALGNMNEKYNADYYASNLPQGKHSTKGVGKTAPLQSNYVQMKGLTIPMGPGELTDKSGVVLLYNQYIVYDVAQIRIKYLLRTKFHYL